MNVERRLHPRHAYSCDVRGGPSARQNHEPFVAAVINGTLVDLSPSGACVIGNRPFAKYTVAPWRFHLPGVPVALPVLAQVRWVEQIASEPDTYRLGLTFLT